MSRHDYSMNTVSTVSSAILNCANSVNNAVLSTEAMPYSWDTGIINNVVAWFEVLQVNFAKSELAGFFETADFKLNEAANKIAMADSVASGKLNECVVSLNALKEKLLTIQEYSVQPVSSANVFDNLHSSLIAINEKYNMVDFDKFSNEEKEDYFNRLKNIPDDQLTEEDKAKIKAFLKYLSNIKLNVTISQEQSSKMDKYIDLYEKLNPDASEFIKNLCKEHGNNEMKNIQQIKYRIYSLRISYQLAEKLCKSENTYSSCDNFKKQAESFDKAMIDQGNFHLCNLEMKKNEDGSCSFSFTACQSSVAKSYGAAVVYDKYGNVVSIDILERYTNPTGFIDSVSSIYDEIFNGGDYKKTKVSVKIPEGGYIEITDDPNNIALIQFGKNVDEKIKSEIEDTIKDAVTKPIKESLKNPGKHATTKAVSASSALSNAAIAYETVKTTAETVDKLEAVVWTSQQKGSGSLILHNIKNGG